MFFGDFVAGCRRTCLKFTLLIFTIVSYFCVRYYGLSMAFVFVGVSLVFSDVDVWYSPYKGNSQSFMEICVMRLLFPIFLHVVFNQCART